MRGFSGWLCLPVENRHIVTLLAKIPSRGDADNAGSHDDDMHRGSPC
jgi:hypothetical protein